MVQPNTTLAQGDVAVLESGVGYSMKGMSPKLISLPCDYPLLTCRLTCHELITLYGLRWTWNGSTVLGQRQQWKTRAVRSGSPDATPGRLVSVSLSFVGEVWIERLPQHAWQCKQRQLSQTRR
ncbi:hypothetical protein O3P69_020106 [Scylla paramamosain]|uniref:Uncharacterized protein n=1 Tax=Scylla paramamosain TaxID=85552 RepID=A0AAW0TMU0_SCYPA